MGQDGCMGRWRGAAALWWAALALAACGAPGAPDTGFAQVSERTTCEALTARFCVGAFGFTVMSDGRFTVGPADDGSTLVGSLTGSEQAQLSADVAQISANLTGSEECDSVPSVPGVSDRVDVVDLRHGTVRVYDLGGTLGLVCYRGGRDAATRLHADLGALLARYYPRPFPPS